MGGARVVLFSRLPARVRVGGLVSLPLVMVALTSAQPAGAVLGGAPAQITEAPWQVAIASLSSGGLQYCGGAILSNRLVLTAAHCVAGDPFTSFVAGVSNYTDEGPPQQTDTIANVRVDPNYHAPSGSQPSADDVAVLELETPLTFGGGSVEPIALAPVGSQLPAGTAVDVTGFGQRGAKAESPPNQSLYSLVTKLLPSAQCGGEAGAFLCTGTSAGTTCVGDSGSGLTLPGRPATLIGLVDRVEPSSGETCSAGAKDAYVDLTSAGVREFIQGVSKSGSGGQQEGTGGGQGNVKSSVRTTTRKLTVSRGDAIVKLACTGAARCKGKLTLTAVKVVNVKGRKRKETVTVGTAAFTIAAGRSETIKIKLSAYGRAQVKSTHGHLKASLSIRGIETEPTHARSEAVTVS